MLQALLPNGLRNCLYHWPFMAASGTENTCVECSMAANHNHAGCIEDDGQEKAYDDAHDGNEEVSFYCFLFFY